MDRCRWSPKTRRLREGLQQGSDHILIDHPHPRGLYIHVHVYRDLATELTEGKQTNVLPQDGKTVIYVHIARKTNGKQSPIATDERCCRKLCSTASASFTRLQYDRAKKQCQKMPPH
jgi:hypothetical protein